MREELKRLQRQVGSTFIFVTHDLHEALLLGSQIVLLEDGKLVSCSTPEEFVRSQDPLVRKYVEAFAGTDVLKRGRT